MGSISRKKLSNPNYAVKFKSPLCFKYSWDWIIVHDAAIIQTDRPQLLLKYLRTKNLHKQDVFIEVFIT
jgi:hypothetical protein